jgi:hypothetical protein
MWRAAGRELGWERGRELIAGRHGAGGPRPQATHPRTQHRRDRHLAPGLCFAVIRSALDEYRGVASMLSLPAETSRFFAVLYGSSPLNGMQGKRLYYGEHLAAGKA